MESEISSSEVLSVRLLETLTLMTPISTESSASGWQRLAVVDLGPTHVHAWFTRIAYQVGGLPLGETGLGAPPTGKQGSL